MAEYVPAPSYPNYAGFLSNLIGNLPTDYRNAQFQQGQVDVQNAFKGGVPTNPDGTPNYAQALQTLAKAGDPGAVAALGPAAQTQAWQQGAPGTLSTMLSGGAGGPATPPPVAPMQPPAAPAAAPAAAPPPASGGPTLAAMVSSVAPDPAQSAKATAFLAKVLGVDPSAPLTPDQASRAQRIMAAAKLGPSAPGQLSAPVNWDLIPGQGAPGAGATAQQPRGLRNNNPGNLESNAFTAKLPGYAGSDGRFAVFDSADAGNAALDRNLQSYARQGISTPLAIAAKWAPGSEAGNNPASYGGAIASALGVRPNQSIDLSDPDTRAKVAGAISRVENGPAATSGGAPQGNRPIVPQVPLPNGFTDPQQAILAIDREIAKASTNPNPYAQGQVASLTDWRNRIAASTAPMEVSPGQRFVDPRTGQTLLQTAPNNLQQAAAERFIAENPNATAEQIQQFQLTGRGARSGIAMYLAKYQQEHPDATDEDIKRVAQDYQSEGTALTRFASGPQGNVIRSFNVLVDHLGTLDGAIGALKNGDIHLFNSAAQEWSRQTGNPAPTNFDATKALVGDEIIKAVVGGAGALGDREEAKAVLDKANSPAQLAGAIDQYRKLALGQLRGFGHQYQTATGRDDFDRLLAPGTKRFFGGEGAPTTQTAAPSGSGAGQPAKVTTEDEYNALPKGTTYIHPDGTTRTKQ